MEMESFEEEIDLDEEVAEEELEEATNFSKQHVKNDRNQTLMTIKFSKERKFREQTKIFIW